MSQRFPRFGSLRIAPWDTGAERSTRFRRLSAVARLVPAWWVFSRPNSHSHGVVIVRRWIQRTVDGAYVCGRLCRVRIFRRRRRRGAGAGAIRHGRGDVGEPPRHHRACGFAGRSSIHGGARQRLWAPPSRACWAQQLAKDFAGRSAGRRRYAGRSPPVESLRTGNRGRRTSTSSRCPLAVQVDTARGRRSSSTSRIHTIQYGQR